MLVNKRPYISWANNVEMFGRNQNFLFVNRLKNPILGQLMRNKKIYIIRVKFSFKFKHRPHGTSDIHLIDPKKDERLSQTRNPSVRNEHGSPGFLFKSSIHYAIAPLYDI